MTTETKPETVEFQLLANKYPISIEIPKSDILRMADEIRAAEPKPDEIKAEKTPIEKAEYLDRLFGDYTLSDNVCPGCGYHKLHENTGKNISCAYINGFRRGFEAGQKAGK